MRPGNRLRLLVLALVLAVAATLLLVKTAASRPQPIELPKTADPNAALDWRELGAIAGPEGLLNAAGQETVWFGGTVWAADSARWEAIEGGVWTFDSGVGSHFDHSAPWVNPYKDPSLHATMEGWVGIDMTFRDLPYFRRVTSGCTVNGSGAMWAGATQAEAEALCWPAGQGYGNNWLVCINHDTNFTHSVANGAVNLQYDYVADTEPGYDYQYLVADTTGALDGSAEVVAFSTTGAASGTANITFVAGVNMRSTSGAFNIKFCAFSDGGYSDEDGLYATTCGALAVDNVVLKDGTTVIHTANFDTGDDGWVLSAPVPGLGGDWSDIVHVNDLPPMSPSIDPCHTGCGIQDSVLVFNDLSVGGSGGHGSYQYNLAMSPWIDLRAAGELDKPTKFIAFSLYQDSPLLNYVYYDVVAQWYPALCPVTGKKIVSPITSGLFCCDFPQPYRCTYPGAWRWLNLSTVIAEDAEQVRVGLGVGNYCRFYSNCNGVTNPSPYFDNVRFGVAGAPNAPSTSALAYHTPQDAFPQDGTLDIRSPGRVDCNLLKGASTPAAGSSVGDTLVVRSYGEVRVQFAVSPGPGIDTVRLNAWLESHTYESTWQGLDWYSARLDTAEQGGKISSGMWMTAYHEEDPNFTGSDTDQDPDDLDPRGQMSRLKNDIFPDDLLTPGSRLCLFYKGRYLTGSTWGTAPDTLGGAYYEMEVLPSSMAADSTFNCLLYVDHADGYGAQPVIEDALGRLFPARPGNFEETAWDRWDVRAPDSGEGSFGRPANTQYGAGLVQALGYRTILWDSGKVTRYNLVEADAAVLVPWLTLGGDVFGAHNLYLSGDGLAESITDEATIGQSALRLLNEYVGAQLTCPIVSTADCPSGSVADTTGCMPLVQAAGSHFMPSWPSVARGSGCTEYASLDVLTPSPLAHSGDARGNLRYNGPIKGAVDFASVSNWSQSGSTYKTVVDGMTVSRLRGPDCGDVGGVDTRLHDVFAWFGVAGTEACATGMNGVGVPGGDTPEPARWGLALTGGAITRGDPARFVVLAPAGVPVALQVFDVAGRRVRTVFSGPWEEREPFWDLRDDTGRRVPAGLYFARLSGPERFFTQRLVVLP